MRDARQGNRLASAGLRLLYRKNGLHISPNHGFLCAAHTEEDIDRTCEAVGHALELVRPSEASTGQRARTGGG